MMPDSKSKKYPSKSSPRLILHEFSEGDERPEMVVYALDAARRPLAAAVVDENGGFDLSEEAISSADLIAVGPAADDFSDVPADVLRLFRPQEFIEAETLRIVKSDWLRWLGHIRCISGDVRHCYFGRLQLDELVQFAEIDSLRDLVPGAVSTAVSEPVASRIRAIPGGLRFLFNCNPVCVGTIEVYERYCCRVPWDIFDPRWPDILDDLKVAVERPDPPFPPDPGPELATPYIKSGALDIKAVNARRDLAVLQRLDRAGQLEYVKARPYLWYRWECGTGKKVGQGQINPDGSFTVCWFEWPIIVDFCYRQYAFVITQEIDGVDKVVYDGRAAGQWFDADDDIEVTIYGREVRACRKPPVDNNRPYALLEHIGEAGSWRLQTPLQTGPRSVGPMAPDSGLADASSNPHVTAAGHNPRDRNWGGTLRYLYYFSEGLKDLGATYYRVSYQRTQTDGTPAAGLPSYFSDGLSWKQWGPGGTTITENLGPFGTADGLAEDDLYKIPYGLGWKANQFHAYINTDTVQTFKGRFLVTLELFDAAGMRLSPVGSTEAHADFPSTSANFDYLRWEDPGDGVPGTKVLHPALTHLFWWDNTDLEGMIEDLRHNGVPSIEECQFLCAEDGSDTFSVGYRAYFPGNALFLWRHHLKWQRGLNGDDDFLAIAGPGNIGEPPAAPGESGSATFSAMLGTEADGTPRDRCSFSVRLIADAKTFDGEHNLFKRVDETASFALQVAEDCGD